MRRRCCKQAIPTVQVVSARTKGMSVYVGEGIVLYIVAVLNIVAFVNDGWLCGRLISQSCLQGDVMLVVVGCVAVALVFSTIAAILQTVGMCLNPNSIASRRLIVCVKVLACIVAIADVTAIFYYYYHVPIRMWNHIVGGMCTGMALAIAIIQLSYEYRVV